MSRTQLESDGWFDISKATRFDQDTWFDGSNHISVNTRDQWRGETLYATATGNWVLNTWSCYQHERDTYDRLDVTDAIAWLIRNNCKLDDLSPDMQSAIATELESTEV